MGERAVVACHRERGVYDLYHSQWAGRDSRIASVLGAESDEATNALLDCEWSAAGVASLPGLLKSLDYLAIDTLYLLSERGILVFCPVWLGIPTQAPVEPHPSDGLLLPIESVADLRGLRRRLRRWKAFLGAGVEVSLLTRADARACLLAVLFRLLGPPRGAVSTPGSSGR